MMPIQIDGETYLTTPEACRAIGVSRETLNRYVQDGLIRRYKRGLARTAYYKEIEVQELARKRFEIREDSDN
jgi:excisionase family DNA binding protein